MPVSQFPVDALINQPADVKLRNEWLEKRGLRVSDFPDQALQVCNGSGLLSHYGIRTDLDKGRPYLVFEFRNPKGTLYKADLLNPNDPPFVQVRFLGEPRPGMLRPGDKLVKVAAPSDRGVEAHYALPPDAPFTWETLPETCPIVIVESMPKAIKVAKETGLPTIGLCGINTFSSTKRGREFILNESGLDLKKQHVYILYDANWAVNPDVVAAQLSLAHKLKYVMGVEKISICKLPPTDGDYKAGPDDYIVHYGVDALMEVVNSAEEYKGDPNESLVEDMNDRAYFVEENVRVVDRRSKNVMDVAKASNLYANVSRDVPFGNTGRIRTIYGFEEWKKSKRRNQVDKLGYRYLDEELYEANGLKFYNTYRRDGIWDSGPVDEKGGELLHLYMKNLLGPKLGLILSQMKFVKYTNLIPQTFTLFVSDLRGVGKSLLMRILREIVGAHNASQISNEVFQGKFNSPMDARRLITVEELTVENKRKPEVAAKIKEIVGSGILTKEAKGVDAESKDASIMLWISTNTIGNIPADDVGDRRMDVVECYLPEGVEVDDPEYWSPIWAASYDERALRYLLVNYIAKAENIDFSSRRADFDASKADVVHSSRDPMLNAVDEACEQFKEMGITAVDIATLAAKVEHLRGGAVAVDPAKLSNLIRSTGWRPTEKKYRPTKESAARPVYVINSETFKDDAEEVRESIRKARLLIPNTKY